MFRTSRSMLVGAFACCLLTAGSGCDKFVPAEGKLMQAGKPVTGATLVFLPEEDGQGTMASGFTGADGGFYLSTHNRVGARPGKYKVTASKGTLVVKKQDLKQSGGDMAMSVGVIRKKELLPIDYAHPDSTPLRAVVPKGGVKDITLQIE